MHQNTIAYTVRNPNNIGPFIFSCEHASAELPEGVLATDLDKYFLKTHWGWDIGAKSVVEQLSDTFNSAAIFSNFSRLWIDVNRAPDRTDLIRLETEGHPLSFNQNLLATEHERRLKNFHQVYHNAFHDLVAARSQSSSPVILISIHSFTPVWNGTVRDMDIGVLFDRDEVAGIALAKEIAAEDLFVAHNEPYTGRGGLMYSVEDKGRTHGCVHLELEINQSLISSPARIAWLSQKLSSALNRWLHIPNQR